MEKTNEKLVIFMSTIKETLHEKVKQQKTISNSSSRREKKVSAIRL